MQSLIVEAALPAGVEYSQNDFVLVGGFPDTVTPCPIVNLELDSDLFKG